MDSFQGVFFYWSTCFLYLSIMFTLLKLEKLICTNMLLIKISIMYLLQTLYLSFQASITFSISIQPPTLKNFDTGSFLNILHFFQNKFFIEHLGLAASVDRFNSIRTGPFMVFKTKILLCSSYQFLPWHTLKMLKIKLTFWTKSISADVITFYQLKHKLRHIIYLDNYC